MSVLSVWYYSLCFVLFAVCLFVCFCCLLFMYVMCAFILLLMKANLLTYSLSCRNCRDAVGQILRGLAIANEVPILKHSLCKIPCSTSSQCSSVRQTLSTDQRVYGWPSQLVKPV